MWLGIHDAMNNAFSEFSFNASNIRKSGEVVLCDLQLSGTHTGSLDLSPMGMPVIPATGKSFRLPVENLTDG